MPKKKPGMTPEEQSQSFEAEVARLVAAGELSPTDADVALGKLMGALRTGRERTQQQPNKKET